MIIFGLKIFSMFISILEVDMGNLCGYIIFLWSNPLSYSYPSLFESGKRWDWRVESYVDPRETVELLKSLIRMNSVNPPLVEGGAGEVEIAEFIAGFLENAEREC